MSLPVEQVLGALTETLLEHHQAILQAPPGAGKTTLVPLAMLDQPWLGKGRILVLEPRRLAARAAAQRMAELLNETVGQRVGYRVRFDHCISPQTRIEVITEGVLIRLLQHDPSLAGVAMLIFDEFHERSLDSDLGLALTLQGRQLFRQEQPLRLLIMSATLDIPGLVELLDHPPVLHSNGRQFPVTLHYGQPAQPTDDLAQRCLSTIRHALAVHPGNLLVFLPGRAEITRLTSLLTERLPDPNLLIAPLYADLPFHHQQQAIMPPPPGQRKIVLSTNLAQTSLTIEGISVVIDSGLSRQAIFDPKVGMARLHTRLSCQASAEQRAGRAGRLAAGHCYRLWSAAQQEQRVAFTPAQILQADLSALMLQLLQWGCSDPAELRWLDPPPVAAQQQAITLLQQLQALTPTQTQLSPLGEQMAQLPLHPRLARLLIQAAHLRQPELGGRLAALLDSAVVPNSAGADLQQLLDQFTHRTFQRHSQQLARLARQLDGPEPGTDLSQEQQLALLVACAWPEWIAKQRPGEASYQLACGRAAHLPSTDSLNQHTWLAVARLGGKNRQNSDRILLACPLDPILFEDHLKPLLHARKTLEWLPEQGRLNAQQQVCCGKLLVRQDAITDLDEQHYHTALITHIRTQGLGILPWSERAMRLCHRVQFLRRQATTWPDFSDQALLAQLEHWLAPYLTGKRRASELQQLDLYNLLLNQLDWASQQTLAQAAPDTLTLPSGDQAAPDYRVYPPVLAVKLQQMFGTTQTPRIGQTKVQLQLLSPAGRPLQITQDLAHFWQHGYLQVRKEMKGRYPKHPWPEDPLTATPTALSKRQQQIANSRS